MEAARRKVMSLLAEKEGLTNLFLAGAFAALSWRSYSQQKEIDALEAEKLALRNGNKSMSSTMWAWRENLFQLAEADPSSALIPLARLRSIFGEEEMTTNDAASSPSVTGLFQDNEMHAWGPKEILVWTCQDLPLLQMYPPNLSLDRDDGYRMENLLSI